MYLQMPRHGQRRGATNTKTPRMRTDLSRRVQVGLGGRGNNGGGTVGSGKRMVQLMIPQFCSRGYLHPGQEKPHTFGRASAGSRHFQTSITVNLQGWPCQEKKKGI